MKADTLDIRLADVQIVFAIACLILFLFLSTEWKINLIGLVTMITWLGTAIAHRSAARANIKLTTEHADVEADSVYVNERSKA